jgi:hypothetical protein
MRTLNPMLLAALLTGGCDAPGEPPAAQPTAARAEALREERFTEPVTGIRFPLPEGVKVAVKHHDPSLPLKKFRHSLHLSTERGIKVLIDVWDNPTLLPLETWFAQHLQFLIDGDTRLSEASVTRAGVQGLVLEQPSSPMAPSLAVAVFAWKGQIFRVTGVDSDAEVDPTGRQLFFQVLDGLELGVSP